MKRFWAILLTLVMVLTASAMAEEAANDAATLKVRGTGVVSVTADQVRVVLGVRETSSDVLEVQSTVNQKINAIYDALIEAGVESKDIATESLYIYANYDYSGEVERLTGYTATNTISITTTDTGKMGEYIDISFQAGANTLDTVDFSSRNNAEAKKEALQLAVQNAYEKAETIAEAAGMSVAQVKTFDETTENYYTDAGALYSNARAEAAADGATRLQASNLQVQATVIVEFELLPAVN